MKLTCFVLISSFIMYVSWGATCRNDFGTCNAVDSAQGCRMDSPRACFVNADGVCYKIINSTGSSLYIPAKAGTGNWAQFYNNMPAGVSKTTECWP